MGILEDIAQEKAKLVTVVHGNKLARRITESILNPILDAVAEVVPVVLEQVGEYVQNQLKNIIQSTVPSGRTYTIYYVDPDAPRGQQIQNKETYEPSMAGLPPKSFTGSLEESITYDVNLSDGSIKFGLPPDAETGHEFESMAYFPGKIYVDVSGSRNTRIPVGKYGTALDTGYLNRFGTEVQRPWFKEYMDEFLRDEIREFIRKQLRIALHKATRRTSVRQALVFKIYFR